MNQLMWTANITLTHLRHMLRRSPSKTPEN